MFKELYSPITSKCEFIDVADTILTDYTLNKKISDYQVLNIYNWNLQRNEKEERKCKWCT